jgi:hypothetical protein
VTAAVEVGAVRWVTSAPAEPELSGPWLETESRQNDLTTSSREPSLVVATIKQGELELIPVAPG